MDADLNHLVAKMDRAELLEFLNLVRQALYRQATRERSRLDEYAQVLEAGRKD